jgi:hypothetical protein
MKNKEPKHESIPQCAQEEQNEILETAALIRELEAQKLANQNDRTGKNADGGSPSITPSKQLGNHLKRDQNG